MKATRWIGLAAALAFCVATVQAAEMTPEETVKAYLTALKKGDFAEAYTYVSKAMTQNKTRKEWAKEQQWIMQVSEAKIFDFRVYPGKVEKEQAFVPNLLSSQDKFLNQLGVEEQELYTLVREDGRWKINQQQLVERSDLSKWFPADVAGEPTQGSTPAAH